jgi:hypothetical protein
MNYQLVDAVLGAGLVGALPAYWLTALFCRLRYPQVRLEVPKPQMPPPPAYVEPAPDPNYFHLLELRRPFTRDEVIAAYRQQAKRYHPDHGGWTEAFRELLAERERALAVAA